MDTHVILTKYEDVKNQTTEEYFNNNQFSIDAFKRKYALNDETYVQAVKRVCDFVASVEKTEELRKYWSERWFDEIYNDWWHPAGSIMQGAGSGRKISLCNCTYISLGDPRDNLEWDNLEGIIKNTSYEVAKCAAYRQGLGVDFSCLRPKGSKLLNSANQSTGAIHWMKFVDNIGYYVGQCLHPDTKVLTENGYKSIKEVVDTQYDGYIVGKNKMVKVINWFKNSPKDIYKVKLEYGDYIKASKDHKILTYDYQTLKEILLPIKKISVGNYVVCDDKKIKRIESIELDCNCETYDITVDSDDHLFSANSIIVSNSGRIPAFLFSLSVKHPDIEEFITCKSDRNKIQNANISVQCTDEFYKKVENDEDWDLKFEIPEVKKGEKIYIDVHSTDMDSIREKETGKYYKFATHDCKKETIIKKVKARKLLELIAKNMHENADPGIQNIDIARKYSNSDAMYDPNDEYNSKIVGSNACSEQYLSRSGLCVLSSINCGNFSTNKEIYIKQLEKISKSINRFLDNVNECELVYKTYATPYQRIGIEKMRRTGAGMTNIAAWLFKKGLTYGSKEGNDAIEDFVKWYNYWLYISSEELGKEKGSFGLFNKEKWITALFVKRVIDESIKLNKEFGVPVLKGNHARNVTCSSIAPTGCVTKNTKIITNIGNLSVEEIFKENNIDITLLEKTYEKTTIIPSKEIKVKNMDGSYQKITKLYYNGYSIVKKIITETGEEICGTIDTHKILVKSKENPGYGEWKLLSNITQDDEIIIEN